MSGYWCLATAYSKHPRGIEVAFREACAAAGVLIRAGVPVFSPIAHSHSVAWECRMDPLDYTIWQPADAPMLAAACGVIVLMDDDGAWRDSTGVRHEIAEAEAAGKYVIFMRPGRVPQLVLP